MKALVTFFYFLPSGVSRWEGIRPNANIMGACGSCLQIKKTTLYCVVTFLYTACVASSKCLDDLAVHTVQTYMYFH